MISNTRRGFLAARSEQDLQPLAELIWLRAATTFTHADRMCALPELVRLGLVLTTHTKNYLYKGLHVHAQQAGAGRNRPCAPQEHRQS
jgi:hypothetical protein